MATKAKAQIGLEDEWLEDSKLEELLERREEAKQGKSAYGGADKAAKEHIKGLGFNGARRCGRFLINIKTVEPRSVSFDTDGGQRVGIKNVEASED